MKPTWPGSRRVRDRVWTMGTGALIAAGLIAASHQPGVLASVALFLSASTMGMLVTIAFEPEELPGAQLLTRMCLGGLVGGGLLVALVGLSVTFGPAAAWPVGLALLTCPDLRRWGGRCSAATPPLSPHPPRPRSAVRRGPRRSGSCHPRRCRRRGPSRSWSPT